MTCRKCGRLDQEIKIDEHLGCGIREEHYILDCTNEQCGSYKVSADGTLLQQDQMEDCSKLVRLFKASQNSTEHERDRAVRLLEREKRKFTELANDATKPEPERNRARTALDKLEAEERGGTGGAASSSAAPPAGEAQWVASLQEQWNRQNVEWNALVEGSRMFPLVYQQVCLRRQKWVEDCNMFNSQAEKALSWQTKLQLWTGIQSNFKAQLQALYAHHHQQQRQQAYYAGRMYWYR